MNELREERSARNGGVCRGRLYSVGFRRAAICVGKDFSLRISFSFALFFPSLSRWPVLCWDINLIRMLGGRDIKLARIFMGYIMGGINRRGALVFRRGEKRRGRCATCDVIFEVPLR